MTFVIASVSEAIQSRRRRPSIPWIASLRSQ